MGIKPARFSERGTHSKNTCIRVAVHETIALTQPFSAHKGQAPLKGCTLWRTYVSMMTSGSPNAKLQGRVQ